jgi:pimeloyl-ACP methyl ester carboxylesterase
MASASVNGVRLFYELSGTAEVALVLVHGSWGSHHNWDLVAPRLAESSGSSPTSAAVTPRSGGR